MNARIDVLGAGPATLVQDLGRPGHLATGLSRGGAADRLALFEAAALLGSTQVLAGIEMAAIGGEFSFSTPMRIALTGAPMQARLDGAPLCWHASHWVQAGQVLNIGSAQKGVYGYLTPAGGVTTPKILQSRATHLAVGLGEALTAGASLPVGLDPNPSAPASVLPVQDRFSGGAIRLMRGPQTDLFAADTLATFLKTRFIRSHIGNRQGIRLDHAGAPFGAEISGQASDLIMPGDIQLTGDGVPYILLCECQTTGGYPRIGTVIDTDLAKAAQTSPGAQVSFTMLTLDEADMASKPEAGLIQYLRKSVHPLVREPHDIPDLLAYQLISGVITGNEE